MGVLPDTHFPCVVSIANAVPVHDSRLLAAPMRKPKQYDDTAPERKQIPGDNGGLRTPLQTKLPAKAWGVSTSVQAWAILETLPDKAMFRTLHCAWSERTVRGWSWLTRRIYFTIVQQDFQDGAWLRGGVKYLGYMRRTSSKLARALVDFDDCSAKAHVAVLGEQNAILFITSSICKIMVGTV